MTVKGFHTVHGNPYPLTLLEATTVGSDCRVESPRDQKKVLSRAEKGKRGLRMHAPRCDAPGEQERVARRRQRRRQLPG